MAMRYYAPFPGGGGESLRPRGPHALRIGDAERDAAAADLGEHYAAGRLTLDELNERLDAVFSAKTFGQLAKIMTDLPGSGRLLWRASRGPGARPGLEAYDGWGPMSFHEPATSSDRAGRLAALSLLMLAMLIWLFTALLFASHGMYHQGPYGYGPSGPWGHYTHTLQYEGPQPPVAP
jgi:Domain of unknown function (DUF1707)